MKKYQFIILTILALIVIGIMIEMVVLNYVLLENYYKLIEKNKELIKEIKYIQEILFAINGIKS